MKSVKQKLIVSIGIVLFGVVTCMAGISIYEHVRITTNVANELQYENVADRISVVASYMNEKLNATNEEDAVVTKQTMVTELSVIMNTKITLFTKEGMNYIREATTMEHLNGTKAVGTILDPNSDAYEQLNRSQSYEGKAMILGRSYMVAYKPITNKNDDVIGAYAVAKPFKETKVYTDSFVQLLLLCSIVVFFVALFILYTINSRTLAPLPLVKQMVKRQSQLYFKVDDLKSLKQYESRRDEIGETIRSLCEGHKNMRNFITNEKHLMNQLLHVSRSLQTSSEQSTQSVIHLIDEIEHFTKETPRVMYQVNTLTSMSDDGSSLTDVVQCVNDIQKRCEDGLQTLNVVANGVFQNQEDTQRVYEVVMSNHMSSIEMERMSERIQSIADQTNLLSASASIEVIRAGEAEKGFELVVNEVRILADYSNSLAKEMKRIVKEVKEKSEHVTSTVERIRSATTKQGEGIRGTVEQFQQFLQLTVHLYELLQVVKEEWSHVKEQQLVLPIVQDKRVETLKIEEMIQEQMESMKEMEEWSVEMEHMIVEFQSRIQLFKI